MPHNANFLADPVVFCNQYALHPKDDNRVTPTKKPEGYYSVPKDQRISYCQIIQGYDFGRGMNVGANSGAYVASVNFTPPAAGDAANWFSVFYLPWTAGQTFRTTLKDPATPLPNGIAMPQIFITSAVDGCSVFVEGTTAEPTVYHANNFDPSGPSAPLGGTSNQIRNFFGPKKTTMEGWVNNARSPKSVRNAVAPTPTAKGVHALDYMDMQLAHKAGLEAAALQGVKDEVKTNNPHLKKIRFDDIIYKPCGTVFGWKQGGNWRFFYQRRAIMLFFPYGRKRGLHIGTERVNMPVCREFSLGTYEFWPGGSGHVFGRGLVDNRAALDALALFAEMAQDY